MKHNGDNALNKSLYNSFYVWARFSFYLLFFFLIICCRQEQIPSDHPSTYLISEVSVYQNPKSLTGESVYLSDEMIIGPIFRIRQLQDNIFFGMQLNQNQYLAALIDIREEKILREIIPPGNAPLELISIFDYFIHQDSFYVIDYLSRRMIATSIDSLVRSPKELTPENSRQYAVNTSFPIVGNITRAGDEIITKNYDYNHPDSAFARLDPYTLEAINYFGKHPFPEGSGYRDHRLRLAENLCDIMARPTGDRYVCVYKYSDLLEIYDSDNQKIRSIYGPHLDPPVLSESTIREFEPRPVRDKTWYGYRTVVAKEDGFYVSYSGKKEPAAEPANEDEFDLETDISAITTILKFDWNGELLERYELDVPIGNFEVDEESRLIIGLDIYSESSWIKFPISRGR